MSEFIHALFSDVVKRLLSEMTLRHLQMFSYNNLTIQFPS